jgi:hypothetical protein
MIDERLFVKMALDAWVAQLNGTDALIDQLTDEELLHEVSPSRNRGIYLLGLLAAEHDLMLPLLRFQAPMFPELKPVFIDAADRAVANLPSVEKLRAQWKAVNGVLNDHMKNLSASDWFTRHANISEDDFLKEPHRNRLNVLLTRTIHVAHHRGQLVLLKAK